MPKYNSILRRNSVSMSYRKPGIVTPYSILSTMTNSCSGVLPARSPMPLTVTPA